MHCPRCQRENGPQAKFCEECGAPLARSCGHCAAVLSTSAMTEPMATVVIQRIERTHGWPLKVTEDLTDEGLRQQFAATAPPAGWHLWHIARWADRVQASFPNHPCDATWRWDPGRQIWFREGLGGGGA
jgi:hypothetical protein